MTVNYSEAARRHWLDADLLQNQKPSRFGNADQLFGFAAECALKAVLVGLGAPTNPRGIKEPFREHIDRLWNEYLAFASGRAGARHIRLLSQANPFADWSVDHRYHDDAAVLGPACTAHRVGAEAALRTLQDAIVFGDVP